MLPVRIILLHNTEACTCIVVNEYTLALFLLTEDEGSLEEFGIVVDSLIKKLFSPMKHVAASCHN